jgi:hypothetical protein
MENGVSSEGKDPSAFLGEIIGAPVTVKLNSGAVYKGTFLGSTLPPRAEEQIVADYQD